MSKKIIIDAGHGGNDSGACGNGLKEKELNLKMSLYQYEALKKLGVNVGLTRSTDIDPGYQRRAAQVKGNYDLCLCNHFNAFNGKASGVEAIHSVHDRPHLAEKLAKKVAQTAGIPYRRTFTKKLPNGQDYFYIHRLTRPTQSIILEYGFIDHVGDMNFYKYETNFYKVADAVVDILAEYALGVGQSSASKPAKKPKKKSASQSKPATTNHLKNKRLVSVHPGDLRFYHCPSWEDRHVAGTMPYNWGFPTVVRKLKVGGAYQYEVRNSKGATYYITASPRYVKLV